MFAEKADSIVSSKSSEAILKANLELIFLHIVKVELKIYFYARQLCPFFLTLSHI